MSEPYDTARLRGIISALDADGDCTGEEWCVVRAAADEIERLRDPSVKCGRGHSPGLPLALWDCPDCTAQLRVELVAEKAAADTVRRSNAAMLEEIDRWREDADQLAAVVEGNRKCHGCGMLCTACSGAYAAALAEHEALVKEAAVAAATDRERLDPFYRLEQNDEPNADD